jgi:hypothetical protein
VTLAVVFHEVIRRWTFNFTHSYEVIGLVTLSIHQENLLDAASHCGSLMPAVRV